jgi:hypothetical protein
MTNWDEINSPLELAWRLWEIELIKEVQELSLARFQQLFDRAYSAIHKQLPDLRARKALWRLGGSAADYQGFHSVVIKVPLELPRLLLASRNKDHRVIGLKLLVRNPQSKDQEIVREIVRALRRRDSYENSGGIPQLSLFLDLRYPAGALPDPELVQSLIAAIKPFAKGRKHTAPFATSQLRRLTLAD